MSQITKMLRDTRKIMARTPDTEMREFCNQVINIANEAEWFVVDDSVFDDFQPTVGKIPLTLNLPYNKLIIEYRESIIICNESYFNGVDGFCAWEYVLSDSVWTPCIVAPFFHSGDRFSFQKPKDSSLELWTIDHPLPLGMANKIVEIDKFPKAELSEVLLTILSHIQALCALLYARQVDEIEKPIKNYHRKQMGKVGITPPKNIRILKVKSHTTMYRQNNTGGTHASPALHNRRGHWRKLKDGREVWVRHCVVGSAEHGSVQKIYEVSP